MKKVMGLLSLVAAGALAAHFLVAVAEDIPLISQDALVQIQASSSKPLLVDVRSADEFKQGHVPGAINIPHDQVSARLTEFGAKDQEIVLYCHSGRRAGLASKVLTDAGFSHLKHLDGDMTAWQANNRPVEK